MRRTTLLLSTAAALTFGGCSTVGSHQRECEQQYARFSDMVDCLNRSIATDRRPDPSGRIKLYLLTAEDLKERVERGDMSEADARRQLQEQYVRLRRDQRQEIAEDVDAWERSRERRRPVRTDCVATGAGSTATMNCTTR